MGKTILYLHGLAGSAESKMGRVIAACFPNCRVIHPTLPRDPCGAYEDICIMVKEFQPDLIVGSSLGGFYALLLHGCRRIVVNPVMMPREDILGSEALMKSPKPESIDEDGTPFYGKEAYLQQLDSLMPLMKKEEPGLIHASFGADKTGFFDHYQDFLSLFPGQEAVRVPTAHVLSEDQIKAYVAPIIAKALE